MDPDARRAIRARAAQGDVAYEDLIQNPVMLRPAPRQIYVFDERDTSTRRAWQAMGAGVALVFAALMVLGWVQSWFSGMDGLLLGAVVFGAALLLYVLGGRSRDSEMVPLVWLSASTSMIRVREYPGQEELADSANRHFDEADEVLFAVRRQPEGLGSGRARLEGAGVFVRFLDGSVWPVIPWTAERDDAFSIAVRMAQLMQIGVKQVGLGWQGSASEVRQIDPLSTTLN